MLVFMLKCLLFGSLSMPIALFLTIYFTRSSKNMPTNLKQLYSEILWQIQGVRALIEDFILKSKNRVVLSNHTGRWAVVTGGNRGIGLRIVEKLLICDMDVILGVRNPIEAQKHIEHIVDVKSMLGKIHYEKLDIGNMKSVREFGKIVCDKYPRVDILINNAGIMAPPFYLTDDGFESQLAVNYLGHFLLTHLLLPKLRAAGTSTLNSRIVNVSSCVHLVGHINMDDINGLNYYYPPDAYNQSKLGQVLFTKHLQNIFDESNEMVQIHSVHPGVVDTDLFVHSGTIPILKQVFFKDPEEGSRTIVFAAISPKCEKKGGTYLSNCRFAKMNSLAKNTEYCKKFFHFTCDMLKVNTFGSEE